MLYINILIFYIEHCTAIIERKIELGRAKQSKAYLASQNKQNEDNQAFKQVSTWAKKPVKIQKAIDGIHRIKDKFDLNTSQYVAGLKNYYEKNSNTQTLDINTTTITKLLAGKTVNDTTLTLINHYNNQACKG